MESKSESQDLERGVKRVQRVKHIKLGLGEKEYWREKEWREAVGWRLGEVLEEREDGGALQKEI